MGLKSDQAIVLRRRVLGGMVRNLVLFSAVFLIVCVLCQRFLVTPIAAEVADSTSVWHTLDSSEQLQVLLAEAGLDGEDLFGTLAHNFAVDGFPDEAGSIEAVQSELDALSDVVRLYATGETTAENAEESLDREAANDLDAPSGQKSNGFATGVVMDVIDDTFAVVNQGEDRVTDKLNLPEMPPDLPELAAGIESEGTDTPVPFISYQEILVAEGIAPEKASAAEGWTAVGLSASIQELHLSLSAPVGAPRINPVAILAQAAAMGMEGDSFTELFDDLYRQSQREAYEQWASFTPLEQSQQFGESDAEPVWQIEMSPQGVYQMRDIATYTFIKSFKIPLVILLFVIGWLVIVLRALNQSLRYFDDLSGAVGKLLADKDAPIQLPTDLSIARNELAVIRSQSLSDERAARAAEQRKNELVAYLAHDIRTPLTSVLGYLDLLSEATDLPRDTLRRYAEIAYSKAERLEGLINEFFEITRYNLSAIPIERETVGVRLFCQQVAESFFPEASARHIDITVEGSPTAQFFVDPDKLARALGNVLRNAVAYADEGSLIALAAQQDAQMTIITVANQGREISEAHLEVIFEKFYREDGARSSRSGGAGLGLAIAREIITAHHGEISATSNNGVTVFTLSIPTTAEAAQSLASKTGRENILPDAPRLKPRYARHGRRTPADSVSDNDVTERTRPQRRNS